MGTTWVKESNYVIIELLLTHLELWEDHFGKIIGTARGLQFQGAKRYFFWYERCSRSTRRG